MQNIKIDLHNIKLDFLFVPLQSKLMADYICDWSACSTRNRSFGFTVFSAAVPAALKWVLLNTNGWWSWVDHAFMKLAAYVDLTVTNTSIVHCVSFIFQVKRAIDLQSFSSQDAPADGPTISAYWVSSVQSRYWRQASSTTNESELLLLLYVLQGLPNSTNWLMLRLSLKRGDEK